MELSEFLVDSLLNKSTLSSISKVADADSSAVKSVISTALPILISGMAQNATSEKGAKSLASALEEHATDADVKELVKTVDKTDGEKILGHILGDNNDTVAKGIAKKSKLSTKQVISILCTLAPIVLSLLGNKKQESNVESSSDGITTLLASLLGGSSNNTGSAIGSIASLLLGGDNSSNDTGDLLSGVLTSLLTD